MLTTTIDIPKPPPGQRASAKYRAAVNAWSTEVLTIAAREFGVDPATGEIPSGHAGGYVGLRIEAIADAIRTLEDNPEEASMVAGAAVNRAWRTLRNAISWGDADPADALRELFCRVEAAKRIDADLDAYYQED